MHRCPGHAPSAEYGRAERTSDREHKRHHRCVEHEGKRPEIGDARSTALPVSRLDEAEQSVVMLAALERRLSSQALALRYGAKTCVLVSMNLPISSRQLQCQKADVRSLPGETWQEWKRCLSLDQRTQGDSSGACPGCRAGPDKAASVSSGPVPADISSGAVELANIRSSPDNLVPMCFHQTLLALPSRGLTSPSRLSRSAASFLCRGHG